MNDPLATTERVGGASSAEATPGHVVDELVSRGKELYSLPKIALDVLELTEKPQTDAQALKACIERDPALTARVLRVVNSALFGLNTQVTDLAHAIGLLGIKPLKLLVLGFSLPPALFEGLDESALELYWKTSLIRAAACREIARSTKQVDGEEAFVAGLLEDLGVLLLIQQLRGAYTRFYLEACDRPEDLVQLERDEMGFDHRQLTSRMLRGWHFPERLVKAIARPPEWAAVEELDEETRMLAQLLRLAEHLVQLLSVPGHRNVRELVDEAERAWQMSVDDVRELVDRLEGSVPPLADIFSVPWDAEQYTKCLAAAHQAIVQTTESSPLVGEVSAGPALQSDGASALRQAISNWVAGDATKSTSVTSESAKEVPGAKPTGITPRRPGQTFVDPALEHKLQQAALVARRCQRPLSLCLVSTDNPRDFDLQLGIEDATAVWQRAQQIMTEELEPSMPPSLAGDGLVAAVCIGHERSHLVRVARTIVAMFADKMETELGVLLPGMLSAGVATIEIPPRNFDPYTLVEAATRCLNAAHASGGQTVKSIAL